jgi:hypothetical protein
MTSTIYTLNKGKEEKHSHNKIFHWAMIGLLRIWWRLKDEHPQCGEEAVDACGIGFQSCFSCPEHLNSSRGL